jgi:hypothetical protein
MLGSKALLTRADGPSLTGRLKVLIGVDAGAPAGEAMEWQLMGCRRHCMLAGASRFTRTRARMDRTTQTPPRAIIERVFRFAARRPDPVSLFRATHGRATRRLSARRRCGASTTTTSRPMSGTRAFPLIGVATFADWLWSIGTRRRTPGVHCSYSVRTARWAHSASLAAPAHRSLDAMAARNTTDERERRHVGGADPENKTVHDACQREPRRQAPSRCRQRPSTPNSRPRATGSAGIAPSAMRMPISRVALIDPVRDHAVDADSPRARATNTANSARRTSTGVAARGNRSGERPSCSRRTSATRDRASVFPIDAVVSSVGSAPFVVRTTMKRLAIPYCSTREKTP